MTSEPRFPHIRVEGGPEPGSWRVFRDGVEQMTILEWQINGGNDAPVTAIFKEIVVFDGQLDVMPKRRGPLDA